MLCSVVQHSGSGRAFKKQGKTLGYVSCFPVYFFRALPLPACFTPDQSTVDIITNDIVTNDIVTNGNEPSCPWQHHDFNYKTKNSVTKSLLSYSTDSHSKWNYPAKTTKERSSKRTNESVGHCIEQCLTSVSHFPRLFSTQLYAEKASCQIGFHSKHLEGL